MLFHFVDAGLVPGTPQMALLIIVNITYALFSHPPPLYSKYIVVSKTSEFPILSAAGQRRSGRNKNIMIYVTEILANNRI